MTTTKTLYVVPTEPAEVIARRRRSLKDLESGLCAALTFFYGTLAVDALVTSRSEREAPSENYTVSSPQPGSTEAGEAVAFGLLAALTCGVGLYTELKE